MDSILKLPNEIICQLYQYMNANDQLRFAKVSKEIFRCFPDWKSEHRKLYINCIKQINEIKHRIDVWQELFIYFKPIDLPTIYKCGYHLRVDSIPKVSSQLLIGGEVIHYHLASRSLYDKYKATSSDLLVIRRGRADTHDANIIFTTYYDMYFKHNLNTEVMTYKHTLYQN
jgi:hypothetical protein